MFKSFFSSAQGPLKTNEIYLFLLFASDASISNQVTTPKYSYRLPVLHDSIPVIQP